MKISEYLQINTRPSFGNKYKNIRTVYNGYEYMSKKEANYAERLDQLKHAKLPSERVISYKNQVPFQIELNSKKICKYIADFKVLYQDGHIEIVDVKGVRTQVYSLKKKLVEAQYGIKIIEV